MMKLYHGSTVTIDRIDLSKSRPNKDFGRGFYLSADRQQAQRMGEFKALTEGGSAVMNTFLFDEQAMSSGELKVLTPKNKPMTTTSSMAPSPMIVWAFRLGNMKLATSPLTNSLKT